MRADQLVTEGVELAAVLDAASQRYHAKDDRRDILAYAAGTIAAFAKYLRDGTPVPDQLKESALLGPWGKSYRWDEHDLVQRTAAFHDALARVLGSNADQ